MIFDGIKLIDGSEFENLVVDSGPSFPPEAHEGELFYRNDGANEGLYIYDGAAWIKQVNAQDDLSSFLPNSGVAAGSYKVVTVSSKGIVTAGSNPTTLFGFGIVDAQPIDQDLTAIAAISDTSGLLRKTATNTWSLDTNSYLTQNNTITVTGDVAGSGQTALSLALTTTGVAAGSYGTSTSVPTITVDSKGRITAASNSAIAIDTSAVTSGVFANARISQASVTQHQAALSVAETQIVDGNVLARLAANEIVSGAWSFNGAVSGQTPTAGNHLTTKDYVDNIASGVNPHNSVKVATTGNITLSGTQTIDGVSVVAGDRVLVKNQSAGAENGVYVVSAGAWTRATDFDGNPTAEVLPGDLVYVELGTSSGNSSWILITNSPITVGTTPLVFSVFSRPGDFEAGNGLTKTANTFNVVTASSSRIVVNADSIDLATTAVTPGTYAKVAVDAYGRVTSGAVLSSGDVTTALGFTPYDSTNPSGYTSNTGTVTNVSVASANGVSAVVANPSTTPAITISLGNISPTSISTGTVGATTVTASTGFSGPVLTAAQPNITSVGTLTSLTVAGATTTRGGRAIVINPTTPLDGDMQISGSTISVFANSAWRQIFPAVYS